MSAKRSNNAIWKLVVPDGVTPKDRLEDVIKTYAEQVTQGSGNQPLTAVPLNQSVPGVQLDLMCDGASVQGCSRSSRVT